MTSEPEATQWSRRHLLLGMGIAVLGGSAACSASSATPGSDVGRGRVLDVSSFGARGDGRSDDTDAVLRVFGAAREGDTVRFAAGKVFVHSRVLKLETPGVRLTGGGTLRATAEQASALQIEAPRVTVDRLTLSIASTTRRWSAPDQHKLFLGNHEGIVVRDVSIKGSAAAGVFCAGSTGFLLQRVEVSDTRADGIHMTLGSRNGRVEAPRINRSGDDGVAVVSYLQDKQPCQDITVTGPRIRTTTGGRGLSVVGGHDVSYSDIDVDGSSAAGVYLACEGGDFVTHPTTHVQVARGVITHANTNAAIDHGAVLVYSGRSGGQVADVTVADLTIRETRAGASRQIGAVVNQSGAVSNIRFQALRLSAAPRPYQGNAPLAAVSFERVRADGAPVSGPS